HPDSVVEDISTYTGAWYPSEFVYSRCGNRHWLCDDRTVEWCVDQCADEYLSVDIYIPTPGDYLVYGYVAIWSDSAVIEDNRGCDHGSKFECSAWYLNWDDIDAMEKVQDAGGEYNVPADYIWKTYPYDEYCGAFGLDTVILNHDRSECDYGDPTGCDFESAVFNLTAGIHTLYIKVAEEFTLLDWLYVAKVGDAPPAAAPGAAYEQEPPDTSDIIQGNQTPQPMPEAFQLSQNYPNPFNAMTVISYTLPWSAQVKLTIYDLIGEPVAELINAEQGVGYHRVPFDAGELASGVYIYSLEAVCTGCQTGQTHFSAKKKMVYLK
ncbi:MAG: T9SS type A sorting domain-containing protein, partial [Fidelibacterota bacterium]